MWLAKPATFDRRPMSRHGGHDRPGGPVCCGNGGPTGCWPAPPTPCFQPPAPNFFPPVSPNRACSKKCWSPTASDCPRVQLSPSSQVFRVAKMLGEAIWRIHEGRAHELDGFAKAKAGLGGPPPLAGGWSEPILSAMVPQGFQPSLGSMFFFFFFVLVPRRAREPRPKGGAHAKWPMP